MRSLQNFAASPRGYYRQLGRRRLRQCRETTMLIVRRQSAGCEQLAMQSVLPRWDGLGLHQQKAELRAQEFSALKKNFILYLRRESETTSRVSAYLNTEHFVCIEGAEALPTIPKNASCNRFPTPAFCMKPPSATSWPTIQSAPWNGVLDKLIVGDRSYLR
jgi:hypothetical protein